MDWQIRIAILIAAVALVGYIYWDFNKKQKTRKANERLKKQYSKLSNTVDHAGFDIDGVGQVRTAVNQESSMDSEELSTGSSIDEFLHQNDNHENSGVIDTQKEIQAERSTSKNTSVSANKIPKVKSKTDSNPIEKDISAPAGDLFSDQKKVVDDTNQEPDLVLTLILQAKPETYFSGKDILPLFLSQGLRHGDMGIFHRHQSKGANPGPVLFSLANAIAPGTINIDSIDSFQTPALALFMTLPGPEDPQIAYNAMVNTARLIIDELGGSILDETRSVYSEQIHNYRLDKIKEYSF